MSNVQSWETDAAKNGTSEFPAAFPTSKRFLGTVLRHERLATEWARLESLAKAQGGLENSSSLLRILSTLLKGLRAMKDGTGLHQ